MIRSGSSSGFDINPDTDPTIHQVNKRKWNNRTAAWLLENLQKSSQNKNLSSHKGQNCPGFVKFILDPTNPEMFGSDRIGSTSRHFHKNTVHFKAVLEIRIRIGCIRIQEGKNTHRKRKKKNVMFINAQCSLLRAETFSYNLNALHRGLNIKKRYIKNWIFFLVYKISQFLFIKTLDSDPHSRFLLFLLLWSGSGYMPNIPCTVSVWVWYGT